MTADNSKSSIGYDNKFPTGTQRLLKVPWRCSKGTNIWDLQGTFRGLLVDQHENWWFNEKMKKVFFRCNSTCFTYLLLFLLEKQIFKSSKLGRQQDTYGTSCGKSQGANDGTFWERPQDVGHTCFLNST